MDGPSFRAFNQDEQNKNKLATVINLIRRRLAMSEVPPSVRIVWLSKSEKGFLKELLRVANAEPVQKQLTENKENNNDRRQI